MKDMEKMFLRAASFNADISRWHVGHVITMKYMFCYAKVFDGDLSEW